MMKTVPAKIDILQSMATPFSGTELPTRIKVAGWGENPNAKGKTFRVNEVTMSMLPGLNATRGFDRVAIDFEHMTVPGTVAYKESSEPRDPAAYGVPEVVAGDGLFLTNIVWTPQGRAHAMNFCDVSPCAELNPEGAVIFLHSVALCRQGAIFGLQFFTVQPTKENADMIEKLAKILGCEPTEEAVAVAMAAQAQRVKDLEAKLANYEAMSTRVEALETTTTAMNALMDGYKASIEMITMSATRETEKQRKEAICAAAKAEGKILGLTPSTLEKMTVEELAQHAAKIPKTVPMSASTEKSGAEVKPALSDVQLTLKKQFNMSDAEADKTFAKV